MELARRGIFYLMLCLLLVAPNVVNATTQTITASGVYIMDTERDETFAVAEDRARKEALRAAVEESGLYLQSVSKTVNNKLTKDELQVLAAAVLKVQSENVSKKVDGNFIEFTVSITAVVDADAVNLDELVAKKKNLENRVEENQRQQEEYEQLKAENERLKADFAKATTESERKRIKVASLQNDKLFQVNQYLDKSIEMLNAGEWLSSLDESKKALETDSTNADALASRARAHVKGNELEAAKDEIIKAIELNPKNVEYKVILGNVYFAAGEYDNAMDYYKEALTKDANNAEAYYQRGMIYFDRDKDYDKAIAEFDNAVAKNPDYAEAYFQRGQAYLNSTSDEKRVEERITKAFDNFNKYLTFHNVPNRAEALEWRESLGETLIRYYTAKGRDDLADKYFNIINYKDDATTHIKRGKEYIQRALHLAHNPNALAERTKYFDAAIAELTKAIELEPNNAEAYYERSEVYYCKAWFNGEPSWEDSEQVIKNANKCLQLNPNHNEAQKLLSHNNEKRNMYAEMLNDGLNPKVYLNSDK